MIPTPRNVVMTVGRGFSASRRWSEPMWSKSVWLSQIQRRSDGSMTVRSASMYSSVWTTVPVSTSTGSDPWRTNELIGTNPSPGTWKFVVSTSMSGAAL
jgi:hypothetical protein